LTLSLISNFFTAKIFNRIFLKIENKGKNFFRKYLCKGGSGGLQRKIFNRLRQELDLFTIATSMKNEDKTLVIKF